MSDNYLLYDPAAFGAVEIKEDTRDAEIIRLRAENEKLREERQELKNELAKWVNCWRDKDVKALSAENDRLRDALKPFVRRLEVLEEIRAHKYATATNIDVIHLRAAAAALKGVTEPASPWRDIRDAMDKAAEIARNYPATIHGSLNANPEICARQVANEIAAAIMAAIPPEPPR